MIGVYWCCFFLSIITNLFHLSIISVQTLLLIHHTDYKHQTSVYVTQTPKSSSVQLGNTVTLQCSFLTKNKESSAQCPSDRSVHWFKSGSGENHPSIIYRNVTHRNSMDDTERRCIYHLSNTIQNLSDTGTYYCAVVTCGVILFGEGSKVDTSKSSSNILNSFTHIKTGSLNLIGRLVFVGLSVEVSTTKALDFSTRKMREGKKKKSDCADCVYSFVKSEEQNQQ
uniref:Ig-like domain-containing protein n=1 Tax=Neolamprologus brichardi TaxID=32507 RepID=A0A3Q4H8Y6_NEOBR